jgi:hypothetical protein
MKKEYILFLLVLVLIVLNLIILYKINEKEDILSDDFLKWAELLKEKGFSSYSTEGYKRILFGKDLSKEMKSKISYLLAESYYASSNFEEAYSYYLLSKILSNDKEMIKEIDKKLVSSLELSGRSKMASKELDKATSLTRKEGKVLAKIGQEDITEEEVLARIDELPEPLKKLYSSKEGFKNFLKSYIASILIERAARRANLQETEDFKKRQKEVEKDVLKNMYLEKELKDKIKIDEKEAREYFDKNKDIYKDKNYDEVKESIYQRLYQEKQNKLVQELIQRLFEAENVKIFEN